MNPENSDSGRFSKIVSEAHAQSEAQNRRITMTVEGETGRTSAGGKAPAGAKAKVGNIESDPADQKSETPPLSLPLNFEALSHSAGFSLSATQATSLPSGSGLSTAQTAQSPNAEQPNSNCNPKSSGCFSGMKNFFTRS